MEFSLKGTGSGTFEKGKQILIGVRSWSGNLIPEDHGLQSRKLSLIYNSKARFLEREISVL